MENGMQGILMLLHFLCSLQLETVSISILELFTEFMTLFLWNLEQVVKYEVPRSWLHSFSNTWKFQFGIHGIF